MRIALGIEYDGSAFSGWQIQETGATVQAAVETALSRVADQEIKVICAGRTDTGVHALEQVVHFDTEAIRTPYSWVFGANASLPKQVVVLWAKQVPDEFHARFIALRRHYRYVIFNRYVRPAVLARRVTWNYRPLDEQRMNKAARHLLGEHNFSAYRAQACQAKNPVRTIYSLEVTRHGEFVHIDVTANAFLHHMVRNIAGVLMTIGAGDREPEWAQEILQGEDRALGGVTAAPYGLYLVSVDYHEQFDLPRLSHTPMVW